MSEIKGVHQDKLKEGSAKAEGEISRRELLKRLSPLGKVYLDPAKCTGCGLCALECPTGALTVAPSDEADAMQLLFKHSHCVACNLCVEICPEKCLRLERVLEPGEMNSQTLLFKDTIVRCSGCGNPIGPKAMIDKLQSRVIAEQAPFTLQAELCPACKVKAQLGKLKA